MAIEATDVELRRAALSCTFAVRDFRPSSAQVRVDIGARSHQGTARKHNGDHYLVLRLGRYQDTLMTSLPRGDLPGRFDESGYAVLVADGLAGTGTGAFASRVALSALAHLAVHFGQWSLRVDPVVAAEIKERGEWFYQRAHAAVMERARTNPELSGMSTTVTAAYTAGRDLFIAHVGHSRAYLFREGILTQLTRDHTVAWHMRHTGGPTAVDVDAQDLQHILTETIGGGGPEAPLVDVDQYSLLDGDAVLLCTNGLTDVISEDKICEVLTFRRSSDDQCRLLVDMAVREETPDNVTAVLAQYEIPPT